MGVLTCKECVMNGRFYDIFFSIGSWKFTCILLGCDSQTVLLVEMLVSSFSVMLNNAKNLWHVTESVYACNCLLCHMHSLLSCCSHSIVDFMKKIFIVSCHTALDILVILVQLQSSYDNLYTI
jgi:hypothetical protein